MRRFIKIRREHPPFCPQCWIDSGCPPMEEMNSHGPVTGERFWCEILRELPDGQLLVRVDNRTICPGSPQLDEIITLPADEEILDRLDDGWDLGRDRAINRALPT